MVLNSADRVRYGMVAAQKIYLGKNLVWDCRLADTAGYVFVVLSGSGVPSGQSPEGLLLVNGIRGKITALPVTAGFDSLLQTVVSVDSIPFPRTADTAHCAGDMKPVPEAFAAGRTYGMVFARGLTELFLELSGRPHPVDTVHGVGASELEDISGAGHPRPTDTTYGRGVGIVLDELGGQARAACKDAVASAGNASLLMTGQAAPTLKIIWADPVQTGGVLYISHAYEATQTDDVLEVI